MIFFKAVRNVAIIIFIGRKGGGGRVASPSDIVVTVDGTIQR